MIGRRTFVSGMGVSILALPLGVDLLVATSTVAVVAGKKATSTIPIVMVGVGDPVGNRLVASLGRPGGTTIYTAVAAGPRYIDAAPSCL